MIVIYPWYAMRYTHAHEFSLCTDGKLRCAFCNFIIEEVKDA